MMSMPEFRNWPAESKNILVLFCITLHIQAFFGGVKGSLLLVVSRAVSREVMRWTAGRRTSNMSFNVFMFGVVTFM